MKIFLPLAAAFALVGPTSLTADVVVRTFDTGDPNGINFEDLAFGSATTTGGVGSTSPNGTPSITGDSAFVTIDASASAGDTGRIGGGVRFNRTITAGELSSTNIEDYDVVLDVATAGFATDFPTLFVGFFDSSGARPIPQAFVNQGSDLSAFAAQSDGNDGTISLSIPLENFVGNGSPLDATNFAAQVGNVTSLQLQLFTTSNVDDFTLDANNVLVVDNAGLSVTATAVPEPSSLALLAIGAMGIAHHRRRRMK